MYDSTHPEAIPLTARMVAGYVDGLYAWLPAAWARFPNAVHVRIAVFPSTNGGQVLDVEQGDATPAQAPGWVRMRRAAGVDPSVYCNTSTWPAVQAEFARQGVAQPHYWVAHYGAGPNIPAGAIAVQYADPAAGSGGQWDISAVADFWPGIDQGGNVTAPDSNADVTALGYIAGNNRVKMPDGNSRNLFDIGFDLTGRLMQLAAQQAGLIAAVSALTKANAANQPITQAELIAIVDQAIAQHIQITGTVQIVPAPAPPTTGGTAP